MTVAKAIQCQIFPNFHVAAGSRGLDRIIRSISIMDSPDTPSWLNPGTFLLTTGYVFKDDRNVQNRLIRQLVDRECAGLAIKIKRFLPCIPDIMLREADRLNLPLLEMPYDQLMSDILTNLTRLIIQDQNYLNERFRKTAFFSNLLEGSLNNRQIIISQGQEYGLMLDATYLVLSVEFPLNEVNISKISESIKFYHIVNEIGSNLDVNILTLFVDHYIVLLQVRNSRNQFETSGLARQVASALLEKSADVFPGTELTIGIGSIQLNPLDIRQSYLDAKESISLGRRSNSKSSSKVFEFDSLKPYSLLQHLSVKEMTNYFNSTLNRLVVFDQENHSELLRTLEVFLASGGRLGEVSSKLYIHRNTVKFRISRIEQLLGVILTDSETVFRLQLSIRIGKLLGIIPV